MVKKILLPISLFVLLIAGNSCDKVENPIKPAIELDTALFPGIWADYVTPTFTQNTNTDRNVVLEDYTGHRCPNCPDAAIIAKDIETANPDRVFSVSVHAAPGGISSFQNTAPDCGTPSNTDGKFCTELFNNESIEYGETFASGFGFFANPQGTINRINPDGEEMFLLSSGWDQRVNTVLGANDLKVNIQAQSNYYSETNGLFLHTEIEFLEDLTGNYNAVVALIENDIVDWQDDNGTYVSDYHHHNVFVGCIDGLAFGRTVAGGTSTGNKTYLDYSYELPSGKSNSDYHVLVYVYDLDSYEILQVIKHEF